MVGTLKSWLGVDVLERENLKLARSVKSAHDKIVTLKSENEDQEGRIAFLENSLTAKASTAKIVPKAHKRTFRQFAEAASKATEEEIAE